VDIIEITVQDYMNKKYGPLETKKFISADLVLVFSNPHEESFTFTFTFTPTGSQSHLNL
jgi:hypothetical protein